MAANDITVQVVYALPHQQAVVRVTLPVGATVGEAIDASGLAARYVQLGEAPLRVGVFGKVVALARPLAHGERVEIYRPLTVDPKEARRRRVKTKSTIKSNT